MTDDRSSNHKLLEEAQLHDIEQFYINTISSNSPIYPIGSLKEDITCMLADIRHLRSRVEAAEQERDKLLQLVNVLDEALDEEAKYGGWDDFMNLVHKEITAYREGSKPDATE